VTTYSYLSATGGKCPSSLHVNFTFQSARVSLNSSALRTKRTSTASCSCSLQPGEMRSNKADPSPRMAPERPSAGSTRPRKQSVRTSHLNQKNAARRKTSVRGDRKQSQNGGGGRQAEAHEHLPWPIKELLSPDAGIRKEVHLHYFSRFVTHRIIVL
jgi:hypothetical protein